MLNLKSNNLIYEGFYNELAHYIQQWRKDIKVDLTDIIHISANLNSVSSTECFLILKAIHKEESEPYGVDTKTINIKDFVLQDVCTFNMFLFGLEYVSKKINLSSFELYCKETYDCIKYTNDSLCG